MRSACAMVAAILAGCGAEPSAQHPMQPRPAVVVDGEPTSVPLPSADQTIRASIAIRGIRPTPSELTAVADDPEALEQLVDAWLGTEHYAKTIRDMHGAQFLVRTDTNEQLPALGPLEGVNAFDIHTSTTDEPLRLVEHVVMSDRPYTEIVTADYMLTNSVVSTIYDVPYDPAGDEWQVSHWTDGRPHAGLLSSSELWRRYRSAGSNHNRQRSNFISGVLLCEPFASRDIVLPPEIDLSDEVALLQAIEFNPACVGCHQAMDPIAAFFWGFRTQIKGRIVRTAYEQKCRADPLNPVQPEGGTMSDVCYPLRMYQPEREGVWADIGLRPPSYFGQPAERIDDLGQLIAADPRFASCTTKRFWSWFAQTEVDDLDLELVEELTEVFQSSQFDAKVLTKAIVTHPRFLADHLIDPESGAPEPAGALTIRPEQYASSLRELTGFEWLAQPEEPNCEPECWSKIDLSNSDLYGFRSAAGGVDGLQVTKPSHVPIPSASLVYRRTASEAAAFAVQQEFEIDPPDRTLFRLIELEHTSEPQVRAQLVALHATVLGEVVEESSESIDTSYALWTGAYGLSDSTRRAWTLTLSALLQDPRMIFY